MCIYFCSPALLNSNVFQVIYSKYTDLVPKEVMNVDDPELQRPDEEAIREVLYALMCLVSSGMLFVLQWDEMYTVVFFFFSDNREDKSSLGKISLPKSCSSHASSSCWQTSSCTVYSVCSAGVCVRCCDVQNRLKLAYLLNFWEQKFLSNKEYETAFCILN